MVTSKNIIVQKKVAFHARTAAADGVFLEIENIPPLSQSRVMQIQIWFGLVDVVANLDEFELYLMAMDVDNVPGLTGVRDRNVWGAIQKWHYETGGHAVQSIEHENVPVFAGAVDNTELATRRRDWKWVFYCNLVSGTFTLATLGSIVVEHTLIQRRYPNDAYTWNDDPGELNNEGISEIDMYG